MNAFAVDLSEISLQDTTSTTVMDDLLATLGAANLACAGSVYVDLGNLW